MPDNLDKETIDPRLFKYINGTQSLKTKEIKNNNILEELKDVCWICDGYQ